MNTTLNIFEIELGVIVLAMTEMNSSANSNKSHEPNQENDTVEIIPPFPNETESFDNPDLFPDLEFIIAGMEKALQLHRKILAQASKMIKAMLNKRRDLRLEWPYDTSNEMERQVLVKALRFCYGETQTVGTKNGEFIAFMAALTRLQVTCLDEVITTLNNFAMEVAKRSLETGIEMLKECIRYKKCCDGIQLGLDKKLAAIVLTKDNMHTHYKEVVDECLMVLPPEYLMDAEFGEPHTRWSEFALRMKNVRCHTKELSNEEKHTIVSMCDWSMLNNQELRELGWADYIGKDELLEAHEKALEYHEVENEQVNSMTKKMEEKLKAIETEKSEETKRAEKAEREREELRGQVEKIEKEKGDVVLKMKEVERERDLKRKEAAEYKKRAEKAESYMEGGCLL